MFRLSGKPLRAQQRMLRQRTRGFSSKLLLGDSIANWTLKGADPDAFLCPTSCYIWVVRSVRILVLLVLAALVANMQCFALCIASAQSTTDESHSMGACHHRSHDSNGGQRSDCDHHHQDLTSAEPASNALNVVPCLAAQTLSGPGSALFHFAGPHGLGQACTPGRGSPPAASALLSVSILRI